MTTHIVIAKQHTIDEFEAHAQRWPGTYDVLWLYDGQQLGEPGRLQIKASLPRCDPEDGPDIFLFFWPGDYRWMQAEKINSPIYAAEDRYPWAPRCLPLIAAFDAFGIPGAPEAAWPVSVIL